MRRYMALLGLAFAACVVAPATASAQVIIVGRPAYYPPVVTYSAPPIVTYSSPAPIVVPQSTTYSYYPSQTVVPQTTYSYYPSQVVVPQSTYSYYPSQSVVTYSSPAPVYSYSAPIVYSSPGVVSQRSYYGFGILRPRGWYTETYVRP